MERKLTHIEVNIVPRDARKTSDKMSVYEKTEIISLRASQIEKGGRVFTKVDSDSDPRAAALKELMDKRCPLTIRRYLTPTLAEEWDANEMVIPI